MGVDDHKRYVLLVCYPVVIQTNTALPSTLLRWAIDRKGAIPVSEQLRSAVEIAVINGDLAGGAVLPSVRQLARELGLASNTVVRAYRELESEGVLRSVPRRGYFVIGVEEPQASPAFEEVQGLIDEVVQAATKAGIDRAQLLRLVANRAKDRARARRRVAVVGRRHAALAERVAETAKALADLDVEVTGLSFEELSTPEGSLKASGIDWYLVPVLETREAVALLGPHAHRIIAMNRTLRTDVREFIRQQPEATLFGVIAGDVYVGRTVATLRRIHPLRVQPISVSVMDAAGVERVLREAEVVVVGSLARPHLEGRLARLRQPWIEFINVPDEATLRRLRSRLTQ